jgi:hypothetical protein
MIPASSLFRDGQFLPRSSLCKQLEVKNEVENGVKDKGNKKYYRAKARPRETLQ